MQLTCHIKFCTCEDSMPKQMLAWSAIAHHWGCASVIAHHSLTSLIKQIFHVFSPKDFFPAGWPIENKVLYLSHVWYNLTQSKSMNFKCHHRKDYFTSQSRFSFITLLYKTYDIMQCKLFIQAILMSIIQYNRHEKLSFATKF